jgi:acyl-CoA thioesterase II
VAGVMTTDSRDETSSSSLQSAANRKMGATRIVYDGLGRLLDVQQVEVDLYEGNGYSDGRKRVYGGQAIAQALNAAVHTVDRSRIPHSLHAYFIRRGDETARISYKVIRDFDGRSFTTRRVAAMQEDRVILNMSVSFQRKETGPSHQNVMPDFPPPEECFPIVWPTSTREQSRGSPRSPLIEIRQPMLGNSSGNDPSSKQVLWIRAIEPLADDFALHRAVLAYVSDIRLLRASMLPHGIDPKAVGVSSASIDHSIWFHERYLRMDRWLLYVSDSPWTGHARGLNRGQLFYRDGRLVASVMQESMMRLPS